MTRPGGRFVDGHRAGAGADHRVDGLVQEGRLWMERDRLAPRARQAFEEALHTYFAVGDVRTATVHGLEGVAVTEHALQDHRYHAVA